MSIEAITESARNLPGVFRLRWLLYQYRVRTGSNWRFWGVFQRREDAIAAASALGRRPIGYDTPGLAEQGRSYYERMHSFDYPALLWLVRFLSEGDRKVVDLGGHLGVKYRAYRRLWPCPPDLFWTVCETEDVVRAAQQLPPEDRALGLAFTADRACLDGADVLFASGVLQYLDEPLRVILAKLHRPPRHLVLNKVPLSTGPDVWTIQNVGAALVPYHVMNGNRFLEEMAELGYNVLDSWPVPEYAARIPFAAGEGTLQNTGLTMSLGQS